MEQYDSIIIRFPKMELQFIVVYSVYPSYNYGVENNSIHR